MRVVGYTRVSVKNGSDSLDAQADKLHAWCREHRRSLVEIREDDGRSGTLDEDGRPGLRAALADLQEGRADALVVANLDRLARELHVQEAVLAKAWQAGARVFTLDGEVLQDDTLDPMRTAMRQMMGVFAQLERGVIVARMQGGRRRRAAAGGYIGGKVPYGYAMAEQSEGGRRRRSLVPVEEEQAVIREMVELRDLGYSYHAIAARLGGRGARRGGPWRGPYVRRVLLREVAR